MASFVIPLSVPSTPGNFLLLCVGFHNAASQVSLVADDGSNSWSDYGYAPVSVSSSDDGISAEWWIGIGGSAATAVTVTVSPDPDANGVAIRVLEFSGGFSGIDASSGGSGTNTAPDSPAASLHNGNLGAGFIIANSGLAGFTGEAFGGSGDPIVTQSPDISAGTITLNSSYFINTGTRFFPDYLATLSSSTDWVSWIVNVETGSPAALVALSDFGATHPPPSGIGYEDIGLLSATTLLFNRVQGTRSGGTQQTADDVVSQGKFLIRTLALPTLENIDDPDVLSLCGFYLQKYSEPEVRFDTVGVELAGLSPTDQAAVAALDIGSAVVCVRNPPGGGAAIQKLSLVEKIDWTADASTGSCKVIFGLQDISDAVGTGFILDSPTQGILDTSTLTL